MDSAPALARFAEDLELEYPLLSDFKREVSAAYGVLNEEGGYANRVTFVVDKEGVIRHIEEGRSAIDPAGALSACKSLT